ncbi:MAG TPA: hypothetical protein VIK04_02870 [Solirubrobacteraceae bacterium]
MRIASPAGRSQRTRAEFDEFVTASSAALLRTAYLVAWDLTEAEDLVGRLEPGEPARGGALHRPYRAAQDAGAGPAGAGP